MSSGLTVCLVPGFQLERFASHDPKGRDLALEKFGDPSLPFDWDSFEGGDPDELTLERAIRGLYDGQINPSDDFESAVRYASAFKALCVIWAKGPGVLPNGPFCPISYDFLIRLDEVGASYELPLMFQLLVGQSHEILPPEVRPLPGVGYWTIDEIDRAAPIVPRILAESPDRDMTEAFAQVLDWIEVARQMDHDWRLMKKPGPTLFGFWG